MRGKVYKDRREAGRQLAEALRDYEGRDDVVVLGLPRGGLPVAYEVAARLGAPLDVFLVRKLGVPGRKEFAMGAIAMGGVQVMNRDVVNWMGISQEDFDRVAESEREEMRRRMEAYRGDRPMPELKGKSVILVDDGLATGATMRAAVTALRAFGPAEIVVAVPTGSPDVCHSFEKQADRAVCLDTPDPFEAVGAWYRDFSQTTDDEVRELLEKAREKQGAS
jgi:predicted phosphoribosyltransferase